MPRSAAPRCSWELVWVRCSAGSVRYSAPTDSRRCAFLARRWAACSCKSARSPRLTFRGSSLGGPCCIIAWWQSAITRVAKRSSWTRRQAHTCRNRSSRTRAGEWHARSNVFARTVGCRRAIANSCALISRRAWKAPLRVTWRVDALSFTSAPLDAVTFSLPDRNHAMRMKLHRRFLVRIVSVVSVSFAHAAGMQPVRAERGMVVSVHALASEAGVEMMKAGGNAIDAAVATGFALAVVYPAAGNLGGGGFMLIRFHDGRTHFLDFREKAPGKATPTMYLDEDGNVIPNLSRIGYLASGVPGSVKGL